MSDNVSCPFCGELFPSAVERYSATHPASDCPLGGYSFPPSQWNMRPPRKEQPAAPVIESEVDWLRSIVRDVIAMKVVNVTLPNGVKVSEGKE